MPTLSGPSPNERQLVRIRELSNSGRASDALPPLKRLRLKLLGTGISSTEPITSKQTAERVWEPKFLGCIISGLDPRVLRRTPEAATELTVAQFLDRRWTTYVEGLMQVAILLVLRAFSSGGNPLLPGLRERIVHLLFTVLTDVSPPATQVADEAAFRMQLSQEGPRLASSWRPGQNQG